MKNESTSESLKAIANKANGKVGEMTKKSTEIVKKSKKAVYDAVDVNGDGQVDIEDVILLAFKVPGVAVKRDVFLKQELKVLNLLPLLPHVSSNTYRGEAFQLLLPVWYIHDQKLRRMQYMH